MGRLGQWVSNAFNKVKNFGMQVGSTLAKVAPKVINAGRFVTGALSHLPGTIGTAAGFLHKGLDYANKFISLLPNGQFKDKLEDLSNKGSNAIDYVHDKTKPYTETAKVIGDTGGRIIDAISRQIPKGVGVPDIRVGGKGSYPSEHLINKAKALAEGRPAII